MSYKTLLKNGAFIIAASLISLTACKRSDTTTTTPTLTTADDNGGYASDAARLENVGNDAQSTADLAATTNATGLRTASGYPTITRTTGGGDTIVTIDFGPTDHLCGDGRNRRGQLIVTYAGHYRDSASFHTISTNNYYVDGYKTNLHKTVTNEGRNSSGQYWYNVTVNDSVVLGTDSVISWTGNRTRTWLAGYLTTDRTDDVYLIGGTTTLTRANGHVFTYAISSSDPLKVALACSWVEAGTVTISSSTFSSTGGDRVLNYGAGTGGCDDIAQVTIAGHTYTFTMH